MYKHVFTVNAISGVVVAVKTVGEDCVLSPYCYVASSVDPDILGKVYNPQDKTFTAPTPELPA